MSELSLIKVVKVEPLGGHRLRVRFSDGTMGELAKFRHSGIAIAVKA